MARDLISVTLYFALLCILCHGDSDQDTKKLSIIELEQHARITPHKEKGKSVEELVIFCYRGDNAKRIGRLFTSARFRLFIVEENYRLYKGENETDVSNQEQKSQRSWFDLIPWKTESVALEIFNKSCIGVKTKQEYKVKLDIKAIDPWLVGFLIGGLLLFFTANRLSKNVIFFYGTGVSVGLIASVLIVIIIMSRFMPKKHYGAYAILVGGWSITLYLLQRLWENLQVYMEEYMVYIVGYFVTAGILSFAVCYYKGPPTEPRKINLIKWGIQIIGLVLIYNGTTIPAVSASLIVILILKHNFPPVIMRTLRSFWLTRFPKKRRLLSEDEYIREGQEETRKELEKLRDYCRSPNCDAWKTISRLKTPQKFASFIEGGSHLSDEEFAAYDTTDHGGGDVPSYLVSDDEEEIDFVLNSP